MRLVLALALSAILGCGGPPKPVVPKTSTTEKPASDLADAKQGVKPVSGDGGKLVVKDPRVTDLDIIKVSVGPGGDTVVATADLFRAAGEAHAAGRAQEAQGMYRQLITEFPDSTYAPISLFNIAAIHDGRGEYQATVLVLEELVAKYPQSRESVEGHLYIAALHSDKSKFADALATLERVVARTNLTYADRVEAFARTGYVHVELAQLDLADVALDAAIAAWKKAPRIEDPYYIAMAHYYRGEVMHKRFEALPMRLPDDRLLADAEQKRVFAAKAYDRWKDALPHHQAYWATAAGYQMSQIFVELWESIVRAPYPTGVTVDARKIYVAELHDKTREHLEKALEGHRMNVELAGAYGVTTAWSKGSEVQATKLLERLAKDTTGVYETPP